MKVILHSCGPEPTRLARMEFTKQALEAAGHETHLMTAGVGVSRTIWTDAPKAMILSSSRINDSLRADLGVPVYAGKTGQKRTEWMALFESLGVQVAQTAAVASVAELQAKLAAFSDVAVFLKPQNERRVSDLRENLWSEIEFPAAVDGPAFAVPLNRFYRRPVTVTPGQSKYPAMDGSFIAVRDPNPNDGDSFRVVLLFGQVLLVSQTSELPLNQRLKAALNADGSQDIAWHKTIAERDANTVVIAPKGIELGALESLSAKLTALGYGAVELEFKRAESGELVLMDFEDGNRVGGVWANQQPGFLERFAAAVVAKANE